MIKTSALEINLNKYCKKRNTYEEYCNPSKANIIEGYCTLERIITLALTLGIIVIPINASLIVDESNITVWQCCTVANYIAC